MAHVKPPGRQEINAGQRQVWHNLFRPPWEMLVSIGYIDAARVLQAQSQHIELQLIDGEQNIDGSGGTHLDKDLLDTGEELFAVSTSSSDIQQLELLGIDANGDPVTRTVDLTGTTPVSTGTWLNVNSAAVQLVGNVGTVYVSTKSTAGVPVVADKLQIKMDIDHGLAVNSMQQIGAEEIGMFNQLSFSVTSEQARAVGSVRVKAKQDGVWYHIYESRCTQATTIQVIDVPRLIPSKVKFAVTAQAITEDKTVFCYQADVYALNALNNNSPPIPSVGEP